MTGEVYQDTEEYKSLVFNTNNKIIEVYKEHWGPLIIGRKEDGTAIRVNDTMDKTQEELIELYKTINLPD